MDQDTRSDDEDSWMQSSMIHGHELWPIGQCIHRTDKKKCGKCENRPRCHHDNVKVLCFQCYTENIRVCFNYHR